MKRHAVVVLLLALLASCTDNPVVLATLAPPGAPANEERCGGNDCAPGTFCEKPTCDSPAGSCLPFPTVCPSDEAPVCGCDGITYFNDCLRRAAGAGAAHAGECDRDARPCHDSDDCPSGTVCSLLAGSDLRDCDRELRGRCWVVPAECPPPGADRWQPCGPPPPGPIACVDTCNAIRSGVPHARALRCE